MNDLNDAVNSVNTIHNPTQAVQEFVGEQFIQWLLDSILLEMRTWPTMIQLGTIKTSQAKIKKFMLQRFLANRALLGVKEGEPGFLRFAIANLSESDDPEAESALEILQTHLDQESQAPASEPWIKLLHELGATDEEIAHTEPKEMTRNFIAELSELCSSQEWPTAIGAFVGYECAEVEEFQILAQMLAGNTNLHPKVLGLMAKPAVHTNHLLDKLAFDPETKALVWEGVKLELQIHQDLLSGLMKFLVS